MTTFYLTNDGSSVIEGPCFAYMITIYKIWKDRAELHEVKYCKANTPLKIKKYAKYTKELDHIVGKFIDWVQAPKSYIDKNKLKIVEPYVRNRKRHKS